MNRLRHLYARSRDRFRINENCCQTPRAGAPGSTLISGPHAAVRHTLHGCNFYFRLALIGKSSRGFGKNDQRLRSAIRVQLTSEVDGLCSALLANAVAYSVVQHVGMTIELLRYI